MSVRIEASVRGRNVHVKVEEGYTTTYSDVRNRDAVERELNEAVQRVRAALGLDDE
jgi:hypothetical protein